MVSRTYTSAPRAQDLEVLGHDESGEIERWIQSGGRLGNPPDWYFLIGCARYLGVAPWELESQSEWIERAKIAQAAELRAEKARRRLSGGG